MGKTHRTSRVPLEVSGIQVNHCKNPVCENFGQAAWVSLGRGKAGPGTDPRYVVVGGKTSLVSLRCKACGEHTTVKSNQGILEEFTRLNAIGQQAEQILGCPDSQCLHAKLDLRTHAGRYSIHGKTRSGSDRYQCKACRRTFSVPTLPTHRQKRPEVNTLVFRLLVNKMPMRRICETAVINPATLYGKIDFIHRQCQAYAIRQERKLADGHARRRVYLAVDRQDYIFNWGTQMDRRNVTLRATGCAENETGYVFGMHLDYDPTQDPETVERAAIEAGDYKVDYPYRKFARFWLQRDHSDELRLKKRIQDHRDDGRHDGTTAQKYVQMLEELRQADAPEPLSIDDKLPGSGMQVRGEYTMYGHFLYLKHLLPGVEKFRFFLDQDAGLSTACLAAFSDLVSARRVEVFHVRVTKDLTVDKRKRAKSAAEIQLAAFMRTNPDLSRGDAINRMIIDAVETHRAEATGRLFWVRHPFPDMGEPQKAICRLTTFEDLTEEHLARLYSRATLRTIDRFFMQVRRRMSLFERPLATASNGQRRWHGYCAYNPAIGAKMLAIFRVFYNFALPGEDGQTPAMRLGLTDKPASLEELLSAVP